MAAQLGSADEFKAFARGNILWLVATGKNKSTGWKNWFEPEKGKGPNMFAFMQEPPSGNAGQVMLPFTAIDTFPLPPDQDVLIREEENGAAVVKTVRIERKLCPVEEVFFASLTPHFISILPDASRLPQAHIRWHLGSFRIPFGCASWHNPTRAKIIDLYLEVDAGVSQAALESAVTDCLKASAVVAALAVLLTPIGWADGPGVFVAALKVCLTQKIQNIIRVEVQAENHCA